jgi:hypothetical protein
MHRLVETGLDAAFPGHTAVDAESAGPLGTAATRQWSSPSLTVARANLNTTLDGAGFRLDQEAATLAYLRACRSISVPATLAVDTSGPVAYLATAPAPGQSVDECFETAGPDTQHRLLRRVGRRVAALHAVRFDDHGTVRGRGKTVGCDETAGRREGVGRREMSDSNDTVESPSARPGLALSVAPWPDVLRRTVEQTREIATTDRLDSRVTASAARRASERLHGGAVRAPL